MARKIPMRRCVATGEQLPKKELLRVVRTPEGTLAVDVTGKANGRGAYLCLSADCFRKARQKKALERSLKTEIPEEIYDRLEEELGV